MSPEWNRITPEPTREGEQQQPGYAPPRAGYAEKRGGGSNTALIVVSVLFALVLAGLFYYWNQHDVELRKELAANNELIIKRLDDSDTRLAKLQSQLTVTQEHVGVTQRDLDRARSLAARLKSEQESNVRKLSEELSQKANTQEVTSLKEATTAQIGDVSQNVGAVKTEVGAVKQDLGAAKADLDRTRKDLANLNLMVDQHGKLIATNAEGLETLRMKGEREYFEFALSKREKVKPVGDIRIELRDTDSKKHRADIRIYINDTKVDKNRIYVNEPVHVRQGREGLDYEVVVNNVQKDQIRGYLSVPKNRALAVSGPKP
ncbi:MAG TPA: hypothetical protein VGQ81_03080 [Acidobacteriota bacterium]|jgi:archaellum component FlaC|nr:hypothetical protein [Acidobacteriota bacterium]